MKLRMLSCLGFFAATSAWADATDDVRCNEIRFSQAVENRDLEAFKALIHEDARFVTGAVSRGPDAVASAWSAYFESDGPQIMWRPQIVEVLEDGKLALSRGPYRVTVKNESGSGTETTRWGIYNSVWQLQDDGSWKVIFDAGSPVDEAPPDSVQALLAQRDSCSD